MGDFLIVGIYDDSAVRELKGPGYPIQTLLDRALSVMGEMNMKYVIFRFVIYEVEYRIVIIR